MSLCCNAQNSPQDYLDAHNAARAAVGVGPMTWDAAAAAYAQNYANIRSADCSLTHSNSFQFGFGENLAAGGGPLTGNNPIELGYDVGSLEARNFTCRESTCVS
nr:pathogenesis-related leaf protein 4-like [Ipomoea trifida]